MIYKQYPEIKMHFQIMVFNIIRYFQTILNELVIFWMIVTSDMAQDGGLGLIVNFSAGVIVSTFDDMLMSTGRVQKVRESFDDVVEMIEGEEEEEEEEGEGKEEEEEKRKEKEKRR